MSYECLAINKSGKCCRNWSRVLEDGSSDIVCHAHRNFFSDRDRIKRYVLSSNGSYLEWKDHGRQRRIGEWLNHNLLHLTPQDFENIHHRVIDKFSILFLLMAQHTEVDLSQNTMFWTSCVKWLWNHSWTIAWSPEANPTTITSEHMITVLCRNTIAQYYRGLYCFPNNEDTRNVMTEESWYTFFNQTLSDPNWAHRFWLEDHQAILQSLLYANPTLRNHPLTSILTSNRYKEWIQESKKRWYDTQKERMDGVKEELMAVTCHPSRAITWTMDLKDLSDWNVIIEEYIPLANVLEEVRSIFHQAKDN